VSSSRPHPPRWSEQSAASAYADLARVVGQKPKYPHHDIDVTAHHPGSGPQMGKGCVTYRSRGPYLRLGLCSSCVKLKAVPQRKVVFLALLAVTACGGGGNQAGVQLGGVIEVSYEVGSHAWIVAAERACRTRPASQPASLARGHVWYAEPRVGEAELLSCLRRQPHILAVALPR